MRSSKWIPVLLLCASCGGSSSETPPPLEPDPKRLLTPPAELPPEEPGALAPEPSASPSPAPSLEGVEEGAEFGIEAPAAHAGPASAGPAVQTWGAAPASKSGSKRQKPPPQAR